MTKKEFINKLQHTYLTLPTIFYKKTNPTQNSKPQILLYNNSLAKELNLGTEKWDDETKSQIFSGNAFENENTIAQAYCGHQFGHFSMLGDGRAILLGEIQSDKLYDIQLKGAGPTIYSRGNDGRAALGPMLREYIISEAFYKLKIPTTRSLAITLTGDKIYRNNFTHSAILTRIAQSHIRVGTFEFAHVHATKNDIKQLADYVIKRHYKELDNKENKYKLLYEKIILKQAQLISQWMLIGFVHGVMNTDNMSISGETIDYGPCAFLDNYEPNKTFSSIDRNGRYAYNKQQEIGKWNLKNLGKAMHTLFSSTPEESLEYIENQLINYDTIFTKMMNEGMKKKLGLKKYDKSIVENLLKIMEKYQFDYTTTFLYLTYFNVRVDEAWYNLTKRWEENKEFQGWFKNYLKNKDEYSFLIMKENNPLFIPRNHLVEKAIFNAENNDFRFLQGLLEVIKKPFDFTDLEILNTLQELPPEIMNEYVTYCGT